MSDIVVQVEHLSKAYLIGESQAQRDTLREALLAVWQNIKHGVLERHWASAKNKRVFWALQDVSFNVKQGTVLGIIGQNGAGKSTLLKILSRITEPSSGTALIRGQVGSLLEVGTGFHPELTGRENIYLSGAILGMRKREVAKRFDEIVAFSGIERFLETPVKRYSSGMYVRLAFAVAAHLEPEILLVDEVLAVGDAEFQRKCLGKMRDVARAGRTVLFVSHNMGAINALTQRCIYLRNGQIVADDTPGRVIEQYLIEMQAPHLGNAQTIDLYRRSFLSDVPVRTIGIWVNNRSTEMPSIEMGKAFTINMEIQATSRIVDANMTVILKNANSERVCVFFSWDQEFALTCEAGRHVVALTVEDLELPPGRYTIDVGINQSTQTIAYDLIIDYPVFSVFSKTGMRHWIDRPWGVVHSKANRWELIRG